MSKINKYDWKDKTEEEWQATSEEFWSKYIKDDHPLKEIYERTKKDTHWISELQNWLVD